MASFFSRGPRTASSLGAASEAKLERGEATPNEGTGTKDKSGNQPRKVFPNKYDKSKQTFEIANTGQNETFLSQLVFPNIRPLGSRDSKGLKIRFSALSPKTCTSSKPDIQQRKISSGRSRSSKDVRKRGNKRNKHISRILSQSYIPSRKKGGGQRPVINLRELNSHLNYTHFKMEGIHSVRNMIQQGDYMIKIDLTDAYFTVPISEDHQKYLQFRWKKQTFQFQCLPFGISVAPLVFTKIMKVPISFLRKIGLRLVIYLDGILIMNQSKVDCQLDGQKTINLLQALGFGINMGKSILIPSQEMDFLGYTVSSLDMSLCLPKNKINQIQNLCIQVKESNYVSVRKLSQVIGTMTASIQAVLPAPLHYRFLQIAKNQKLNQTHNYNATLYLNKNALEELDWWIHHLEKWNGKSLIPHRPSLLVQSDASKLGWGGVCQDIRIGGPWLESEKHLHINALEILAVTYAVKAFVKNKTNLVVLIQTDNRTTQTYINKMGGTRSELCSRLALDLWDWCLERNIFLRADFIPGKQNVVADWESRHHRDSSNWKLNPDIFQSLMSKTLMCNIDLFADRTNHQLPIYMSWLPDPGAKAFDALAHPWTGLTAYAFPPFCLIPQCLNKIMTEKVTVVMITPAWSAQPWYTTLLHMSIQDPILLPIFPQILTSTMSQTHPLVQNNSLRLVAWLVSGDPLAQWNYQKLLKTFSLTRGDEELTKLTIRPGISGVAGVCKGKLIPFQHL